MGNRELNLPDFVRPPLIETAIALEFAPLTKFKIPHFGIYWERIRSEYPEFDVRPVIQTGLDEVPPGTQINIEINNDPNAVRCWFMDATKSQLIQVQNNRFINNWRKLAEADQYPRYKDKIRPRFKKEWARFREFVTETELGELSSVRGEMTYINHIDFDDGWENYKGISSLFPLWSGKTSAGFLPAPTNVTFAASYPIEGSKGSLAISLHPVIRLGDQKKILQLTLVARGRPDSDSDEDILAWLDLAREWIVRGFADVTSPKLHAIWERKGSARV
jgi:uncharacterized protein (TIGR04255 family)